MKSHSQAGQDLFVAAICRGNTNGRFLDIGCSHPKQWSNTRSLEELGWRGVLVDSDSNAIDLCKLERVSPAICCDATKCDWRAILQANAPDMLGAPIDYLSCDIDEWTHEALKNVLSAGLNFRVITVEHDHYQRGDRLRIPNRELLCSAGYAIIAEDVHSSGCCFEDWFIRPQFVDVVRASKFVSSGLEWDKVLELGGAL